MNEELSRDISLYSKGLLSRRELLRSVIAITGSYTTAHLFLESSGLAATLISEREAQAANLDAETVQYPSGAYQIHAYLVAPKSSGTHPAIVVIHENRGLNEHIRDVARRFAAEGFVAIAPDLLSRVGGTAKLGSPNEAVQAITKLPPYSSVEDLKAGVTFLEQHASVDPQKISSVGFCWGGWRSFVLATQVPVLYRSVIFYGATPETGLDGIHSPILAHYAQLDHRITGNAAWTAKTLKEMGKKYTYYVYPNASHAFFNDTGPNYDAKAAESAWARTLDFLRSQ